VQRKHYERNIMSTEMFTKQNKTKRKKRTVFFVETTTRTKYTHSFRGRISIHISTSHSHCRNLRASSARASDDGQPINFTQKSIARAGRTRIIVRASFVIIIILLRRWRRRRRRGRVIAIEE